MDCRDCPGVFEIPGFCFAEYTIILYKYFLTNFVIIINPAFVFTSGVTTNKQIKNYLNIIQIYIQFC